MFKSWHAGCNNIPTSREVTGNKIKFDHRLRCQEQPDEQ